MNTNKATRAATGAQRCDQPSLFHDAAGTPSQAVRPPKLPIPIFGTRLVRDRDHLTEQVSGPADAARIASELLAGYDREVFLVIALTTANRIIGGHIAHMGTLDASIASPREVFRFGLLVNAKSVILAHNHPSGNLEPSKADIEVSKAMKAAGTLMAIEVLDSLIIGYDGQYTSLAKRCLL